MAVQKRRKSKSKKRMRKAANAWHPKKLNVCSNCASTVPGHTACPSCGFYNNRQVIRMNSDLDDTDTDDDEDQKVA